MKVDNLSGFFVGPMIEFKFPVFGLGVDGSLLYSQTKMKFINETTNIGVTNKQHELDIPVNLKWSHSLLKLIGIYLAAGPDFSFNLKSDNIGSDLADIAVSTVQEDKTSIKRKAANVGLNFGAGIILVKHLQVGFNYNLPLTISAREDIKDGNVANAIGLFLMETLLTRKIRNGRFPLHIYSKNCSFV
ncbi:MAG: outer membrane beta-barrel protein [Coprobacter fastidiosus]